MFGKLIRGHVLGDGSVLPQQAIDDANAAAARLDALIKARAVFIEYHSGDQWAKDVAARTKWYAPEAVEYMAREIARRKTIKAQAESENEKYSGQEPVHAETAPAGEHGADSDSAPDGAATAAGAGEQAESAGEVAGHAGKPLTHGHELGDDY